MTRAKDLSKIVTDADLSGTLDVTGAFTSQGIDDNANATAITIDSSENVGIGTASPNSNGLHVEKSASNAMGVTISNTEGSGSRFDLYAFGSSPAVQSAHRNAIYQWTGNGIDLWSRVGDLHFGTNNTEKMRIDSNGNVGIGTTSLDLVGSTTSLTINNSGGNGQLSLMGNGTVYGRIFADNATGDLKMGNPTSNDFMFYTANLERMRITSAGNVGIGTDSPFYTSANRVTTSINGGTGGAMLSFGISGTGKGSLFQDGDNLKVSGYPGYLYFATGNIDTERMRIDSNGNVGIGNTNPNGGRLHVTNSTGAIGYFQSTQSASNIDNIILNSTQTNSSANATFQINNGTTAQGQIRLEGNNSVVFLNGTSLTERMRIDSSGNVGIGNSSPSSFNGGANNLVVGTGSGSEGITIYAENTANSAIFFADTDNNTTGQINYEHASNAFAFHTNGGTERLRIDSAGRGTFTSTSDNTISSGQGIVNVNLEQTRQNGKGPFIGFRVPNHATSTTNEDMGAIGFVATDSNTGSRKADFVVYTRDTTFGEKMRMTHNGNLGINESSPDTKLHVTHGVSGTPLATFENTASHEASIRFKSAHSSSSDFRIGASISASNNFEIYSVGAAAARLQIDSTGLLKSVPTNNNTTGSGANMVVFSDGQFARSTSSLRYKNTVNDATHGLTELLTLRPVTYKGNNDGDTIFGGLIAEEVHDAGLTEFVQYNDDGQPDALYYGNMVSLCIKAIQELKAELDSAKARITTLENGE